MPWKCMETPRLPHAGAGGAGGAGDATVDSGELAATTIVTLRMPLLPDMPPGATIAPFHKAMADSLARRLGIFASRIQKVLPHPGGGTVDVLFGPPPHRRVVSRLLHAGTGVGAAEAGAAALPAPPGAPCARTPTPPEAWRSNLRSRCATACTAASGH